MTTYFRPWNILKFQVNPWTGKISRTTLTQVYESQLSGEYLRTVRGLKSLISESNINIILNLIEKKKYFSSLRILRISTLIVIIVVLFLIALGIVKSVEISSNIKLREANLGSVIAFFVSSFCILSILLITVNTINSKIKQKAFERVSDLLTEVNTHIREKNVEFLIHPSCIYIGLVKLPIELALNINIYKNKTTNGNDIELRAKQNDSSASNLPQAVIEEDPTASNILVNRNISYMVSEMFPSLNITNHRRRRQNLAEKYYYK